jgi:hypothetical protein
MEQKIVIHMKDGKIHKGVTQDFDPDRGTFHFLPAEGGGVPMRIDLERMKAVFWVKDYIGNRNFVSRREFGSTRDRRRPAVVTFADGEEMWGSVAEVDDRLPGFFFYPGDEDDNNIRVYVIRSATKGVRFERVPEGS